MKILNRTRTTLNDTINYRYYIKVRPEWKRLMLAGGVRVPKKHREVIKHHIKHTLPLSLLTDEWSKSINGCYWYNSVNSGKVFVVDIEEEGGVR